MYQLEDRPVRRVRGAVAVLLSGLLFMLTAPAAIADTALTARIETLPYSDAVDFAEAERSPDCYGEGGLLATVWYSYTPTDDMAVVFQSQSNDDFLLTDVRTGGSDPGSSYNLACGSQGRVELTAGTTYYFGVQSWSSEATGTFTLQVAPPAFDITNVTVTSAQVQRDGSVILTGTVTCNQDGWVEGYMSLRQKVGLNIAQADAYMSTTCSSTPSTWTTSPVADSRRAFVGGRATLTGSVSGGDGYTWDWYDLGNRTIRLRGR